MGLPDKMTIDIERVVLTTAPLVVQCNNAAATVTGPPGWRNEYDCL
jgi:hypothetical protein